MLEERRPKNRLNKDYLFHFQYFISPRQKKKAHLTSCLTEFPLNYQTILSFLSKMFKSQPEELYSWNLR